MATATGDQQRVAVPRCPYGLGVTAVLVCAVVLFGLNARASAFDTISSALGLYSAALLVSLVSLRLGELLSLGGSIATSRWVTSGARLSIGAYSSPSGDPR